MGFAGPEPYAGVNQIVARTGVSEMTNSRGSVQRLSIERGWIIALAIVAIVLAVIALIFPAASLITIAILFGIYLVASGIFRLTIAFTAARYGAGIRILTGILGGLVIVAGILCLADPFESLQVLAVIIGIGWILEGIATLLGITLGTSGAPRWFTIVSGILAVVAGIIMLILPVFGLAALLTTGAILLLVLAVSVLLTLPALGAKSHR